MKKILKWTLGLSLVGFLGLGVNYYMFINSNVGRCVKMFVDMGALNLENDPVMKEFMKKEGFDSIMDLIIDRCKTFDKNGQKF